MMLTFDVTPTFEMDGDPRAEMTQERDARLLVAGTYPDKGLRLTPEDLDGIVSQFAPDTVPVKVEHTDTPFNPLGLVKKVWRDGAQLMATLAFPPDLATFLKRRGIAKLSVGLAKDPLALAEVSLVARPRVPVATLMSAETEAPAPSPSPVSHLWGPEMRAGGDAKDLEIARLRRELQEHLVGGQMLRLKREGRLVPAAEPFARALLADGDPVIRLFSDAAPLPVADVFLRFLATMPPVISLQEMATATLASPTAALSAKEATFLRDRLGVDPAEAVKYLPPRAV